MPEKMSEVYEAYDMEVLDTGRGRGATILKTDKGIMQLMPHNGTDKRLAEERDFKNKLYEKGFIYIDRLVANNEDELTTCDRYGNPYVMREYFEGKECVPTNVVDLKKATANLAEFHLASKEVWLDEKRENAFRYPGAFDRKNAELKKIRSFISKRNSKGEYELMYMKVYDYFYKQGYECEQLMKECDRQSVTKRTGYCHGTYNYHSVLFGEDYTATVCFDRFHVGYQLTDLYQFIRKVMEKNNYKFEIIVHILSEYDNHIPLSDEDYYNIYLLYRYPEKFWKIGNRYMNSRKSWISPINKEKLEKVIEHEQEKQKILKEFSQLYGVHKMAFSEYNTMA